MTRASVSFDQLPGNQNMQSDISHSTVESPDLDWSQIDETVRMLNLTMAQIEIAMRDSDLSMQQLINAFTLMVDYEREIAQQVDDLEVSESLTKPLEVIKQRAAQVSNEMQTAIVAFQFYDKLNQRVMHVAESLEALGELIGDSRRIYNPRDWLKLQQRIRDRYTMREEREMFDSIMNGADVREAIRRYDETHKEETELDTEFF